MSLLNKIKKGVASSGSNRGKVLFIAKDSKRRVRFLQEVEDGLEVLIHDSFDLGIKTLCQKHVGKPCPYCDREDLRHRNAYVYSVFDVENKEVKLYEGYANNFNPLPSLIAMYESYETLMDRDYVIQREGSGTNTRYSVVPMDKVKFKNKKAKPYSKKKTLEILSRAFPINEEDLLDDDDEEEEDDFEENENDDWDDDDEDEEENDYDSMKPSELYRECVERGIKVKKKMKKQYYIDKLLDDDFDDEEDDDDDDW